jgi:precorrin-2 dehydrogenase / sirohydrochlorin ferrochelatase
MINSLKRRENRLPPSANKFSYPLFLDLIGKICVVVGGGRVAQRKCLTLVKAGAAVTIISPTLTPLLEKYKRDGLIIHKKRRYQRGDIKTAFLVIAATDSEKTNKKIALDATAIQKLLNVVDNPSLCNFIVPSVVKRSLLTIAISTGGASPSMAKAIRKELEKLYGPEFSRYLRVIKKIRSKAMEEIPDKREREKFLKNLIKKIFRA